MLIPTFALFYYDACTVVHTEIYQIIQKFTRTYIQAKREIIITVQNVFKNCFAGYL